MGISAVLLAGGKSVRMARDKTALTLHGETLIERHLRQLRSVGVEDVIAVCNPDNQRAIAQRTAAVLQRGSGMSGAVLTGLQSLPGCDGVWLVCVNDVISDAGYQRIAASPAAIAIGTRILEHRFEGGMLDLTGVRVQSIVERPPGGCPPGSPANIMVHRLTGGPLLQALEHELARGIDYESAINHLIATGVDAEAVSLDFWIAIKTPEDYDRCLSVRSQ